ncbi:MAG: insulinase family protein [Anaerolineae bacterium]|nr:insulinase family protein [Anaerolineae bacterium]
MDLTFTTYTLSNGITVIVKENHHAHSVVVRSYLQGGANLEKVDEIGLASFTTSAMRRGTQKHTYTEINEIVESVAASVYVNTGRHLTGFGGKSLAEDFKLLIELMTDNLLCPTFPADEIEKLRGQIITDLKEDEDDTRTLAGRYFREMLYTFDHPYGRPIDGTLKSIPGLTRDDLLGFYHQLHPQAGIVVVVGDITGAQVYQTLEATLGQWQPDHSPPDTTLPPPRPLTETAQCMHPMENKSQADLVLGWMGPNRRADDFYAAYVGNTILGQLGLGGRIGQSVRDTEGLAYYVNSNLQGGNGPGPWFAYAGVNHAGIGKAVSLILAEIRRLRQEPVTDQELADAKAYLTGIMPLQMETNEGVASILLDMQLYKLGDDFISRYPDIINAVTKAEIQAASQKYLDEKVYALSIAGPNFEG